MDATDVKDNTGNVGLSLPNHNKYVFLVPSKYVTQN